MAMTVDVIPTTATANDDSLTTFRLKITAELGCYLFFERVRCFSPCVTS